MTRPAKPGDKCIMIRDGVADGRNVGKQVDCKRQCKCQDGSWEVEAMEPIYLFQESLGHMLGLSPPSVCQYPAGTEFCCPKNHIVPLEDPDKGRMSADELREWQERLSNIN